MIFKTTNVLKLNYNIPEALKFGENIDLFNLLPTFEEARRETRFKVTADKLQFTVN